MNIERVIKFCENEIVREQVMNKSGSKTRIDTYKKIIEHINNADKAELSEVEEIKKIFENHYAKHIQQVKNITTFIRYSWNKRRETIIQNELIPIIKREIGNNLESYGDMTAIQFFESFMQNMPMWWKENCFDIELITRKFDIIYQKILTISKNGMGNKSQKVTVSDVLGDLKFSRDVNFNGNGYDHE